MKPRSWAAVWLCARQELRLSVRSRWTQTFTVVFAALALAVSASGYVLSGGSGIQDFARTAASLVQLVLLLVPLTSLVFGVMALTPDAGAAELLFSQPIARQTVLAGRLLGVFLAIVSAQSIGFGAAGLVLFARTGQDGVLSFLGVVGGAFVLTGVFLALAALVAAGDASTRRARNLALVLVVWFVAVVLFDVAALGVASLLPSGLASRVLMVAAIVNPVDAVRTGTLLAVEGPTAFGAASLAFLRFTGGAAGATLWLGASLLLWILAPLSAAVVKLNRADI
ncbi:MAG TPA: ABC transporter permease subunit [Vicinamibacterales bacterium]|nr:ABC transporter permease subunit [Vicinamibacterales bacterium]